MCVKGLVPCTCAQRLLLWEVMDGDPAFISVTQQRTQNLNRLLGGRSVEEEIWGPDPFLPPSLPVCQKVSKLVYHTLSAMTASL